MRRRSFHSQLRQLWLPATLVLYLFLALSTVFGRHGLLHLWQLRQEQRTLEAEVFTLVRENEDLRERIARLESDDEFFEKIVREGLGFVRPGEIVYRFPRSSKTPVP